MTHFLLIIKRYVIIITNIKREDNNLIIHPIKPVYDTSSAILILGSFPSVKSREDMFFYAHPQNRFWKVIATVFGCDVPDTLEEKKELLLSEHVALWDVIGSCDIEGSADSTIKNVFVNDISIILKNADIKQIYVNGKTAEKYYNKYLRDLTGRDAICLPSTSPANAAYSMEKLVMHWSIIREN